MSYAFAWEEEAIASLLLTLFTGIPSGIFGVVCYVLRSMALYTIAQRREIRSAWLAWVPILSCWILGSLSDQYRYVVKGQFKSKRKWLVGLNLTSFVLICAIVINIITMAISYFTPFGHTFPMVQEFTLLFAFALPLAVIQAAITVIRFMALYDVYVSVDPDNAVLFLVLSILIKIVEPFFLFFSREKDLGMPPRRDAATSTKDAWTPDNKGYL